MDLLIPLNTNNFLLLFYNMRKIDKKDDDPIDNVIYDNFVVSLTPLLRNIGFTPNMVTISSIIIAFIGIYYLTHKNLVIFTILFAFAYILDNIDGNMARLYNMQSKLGDFLDHCGDIVKILVLLYALYDKFNLMKHPNIIILIVVLMFLTCFHIGCQENLTKYDGNNGTLSLVKMLCKDKQHLIKYTRYFGPGSFILYITIISCYLVKLS